ncbi:hypothetical protein HUT06_23395 [Actinomadura sp. NAK00032]|uniref:hypothetical protein n=1 Tax=Actinomadura sp. NAK00032 TaxID=2742128 RepID=UPI0015913F01|nr:hypothetical protein [Actinomadura sp. NAK00032]QKW36602.1 hypothetical protein HUT06_23395 [Actinomadura sp. NAK00032]
MTDAFAVLHALCVKGMAGTAQLSLMTGRPESAVLPAARNLAGAGAAVFVAAREVWRVTEQGRSRHAAEVRADLTPDAAATLRACHDRFVPLDHRVKELCTRWQRGEAAEADVRAELADLHRSLLAVAVYMAGARGRYAGYARRLTAARDRFESGDAGALTGVLCDSYHEVWMELHRDLRLTLDLP